MKALGQFEVWFVAGSHDLYGDVTLSRVDEHSREVAERLDASESIPVRIIYKPVLTNPESIRRLCLDANAADDCVGLIAWMHTFSPAKMWIAGLGALQKPLLHLHTQFNRDLPWGEIDMDFMNLNQSAHGDREFGFLETRMGLRRKTVVGHWSDPSILGRIGTWARAACGWREAQTLSVARFGDNMRYVAVTEGDKVEAQLRLGVAVHGYGVSKLVDAVREVPDSAVDRLVDEYEQAYTLVPALQIDGERRESLRDAARIEAGLRDFLEAGVSGVHRHFRGSRRSDQLPGIAVNADGGRLRIRSRGRLEDGGARPIAKVMSTGLKGGTSFMEDYTYHLAPDGPRCLARTCSRSVPRSRPRSLPARSTRSRSAAKPTRSGLVFTPPRARLSRSGSSIWAIASGLSRTRSSWCRPRETAAAARRLTYGGRSPTSRPPPRLAARGRTTPHGLLPAIGTEAFADLAEIAGVNCS